MRFSAIVERCVVAVSLSLLWGSRAVCQATPGPFTLNIVALSGVVYPSFRTIAVIDVHFDSNPGQIDALGYNLQSYLKNAVAGGWNCLDVKNYQVVYVLPGNPGEHPVKLDHVTAPPCDNQHDLVLVHLYLAGDVKTSGTYTVRVLNVKTKDGASVAIGSDGKTLSKFDPKANPVVISATPQSVLNEPLTDGTYKGVQQLALNASIPLSGIPVPGAGALWYLASKDVFSSNEHDKKSAFAGGFGYEIALLKHWYMPFTIEQDVQGNQVATNLSTVTTANVVTEFGWNSTSRVLQNPVFQIPLSPTFALSLPYTHRINQLVSAKSKALPVDDFAVNPSLALAHATLLKGLCNRYQNWANPGAKPNSAQFCLGLEADLGMYYLPLQLTSQGNQRAEGYGDVSFLIPISDFQRPLSLVSFGSQALLSQFRIEYADSVSPANNYTRTKKWSFGVELIK
jgi:hypothetical protein